MKAFSAVMKIESEKRLWQKYSADCLGSIVQGLGSKDLPLYTQLITHTVKPKETAQQVIEHVKNLFS